MNKSAVLIIVALSALHTVAPHPAPAAIYVITNPADKINNPADKMYNPATQINNPAAVIDNPAGRMDNPTPLTPVPQAVPQISSPGAAVATPPAKQAAERPPKPAVPHRHYPFKTVKEYIAAAKKAFAQDDYLEFLAITEDALRHIGAGTLKASKKSRQKLLKYQTFGYGLLADTEE